MSISEGPLAKAIEAVKPFVNQDAIPLVRSLIKARIEVSRDKMEKAETEGQWREYKGKIKGDRELLKYLSE